MRSQKSVRGWKRDQSPKRVANNDVARLKRPRNYQNTPRCQKNHKVIYLTRDEALSVLHAIQNSKKKEHQENRAYRCDACHLWHLTSKPQLTPKAV